MSWVEAFEGIRLKKDIKVKLLVKRKSFRLCFPARNMSSSPGDYFFCSGLIESFVTDHLKINISQTDALGLDHCHTSGDWSQPKDRVRWVPRLSFRAGAVRLFQLITFFLVFLFRVIESYAPAHKSTVAMAAVQEYGFEDNPTPRPTHLTRHPQATTSSPTRGRSSRPTLFWQCWWCNRWCVALSGGLRWRCLKRGDPYAPQTPDKLCAVEK